MKYRAIEKFEGFDLLGYYFEIQFAKKKKSRKVFCIDAK